jgi:hypothetical protein
MRSARILLALCFGVWLGGQTVTFSEHVAPILFHNCAICHRPGEAGPFTLLSYQHAQSRGRQIAEVTASGYMPPWKPEAGYAEYKNKRGVDPGTNRSHSEVVRRACVLAHVFPERSGWRASSPQLAAEHVTTPD